MMPLSEILFLAIVVYLLYRFLTNFLLPVVRATRHVREQFRNMQGGPNPGERAGQPFQQAKPNQPTQSSDAPDRRSATKPPADDYIDFEEVK